MTDLYLSSTDNSDPIESAQTVQQSVNTEEDTSEDTVRDIILYSNLYGEDRRIGLLNARYMALNHVAVSDTAKSLCQLLAAEATAADPDRKRGRRGAKKEQFERAVAAVVADLFLGHGRHLSSMSYRPLGPNEFTGSGVSYRNFMAVLRGFEALGLIERVAQGFFNRSEISKGYASRFQPSFLLLEISVKAGFLPSEVRHHFEPQLPASPLVLRASSKRMQGRKVRGRTIKFEPTEQTCRLEAEIREINEFVSGFDIQGGTHRGFQRIFNCGDQEGFAWNKGGRLYSIGEDNYQQLPSKQRSQMRINGEPIVEIDIQASYLTILHSLYGQQLYTSIDPYDIAPYPRAIIKQWIIMTLGHHGFHRAWPKEFKQRFAESGQGDLHKCYPIDAVREAVTDQHPVISDWPRQEYECHDLMYREAVTVIETMLALKRSEGIVALPVHDSIIVPRSATRTAEQVFLSVRLN